jgi:AraC-like DNA-binding protein
MECFALLIRRLSAERAKMYRFFSPAKTLDPYVECFWTLHASRTPERELSERIFVDGRADLIFNFGCPYRREIPGRRESSLVACSNLDAPRDHPVFILQQGEIHLTGVRFKPGGLAAFLPVPLHELRNQVIEAGAIFGRGAVILESRLFDCLAHPEGQVARLEEYLLSRLAPGRWSALALQLARRINASAGQTSLRMLSREAGYSPRHLDRIFQQCFGVSPKFQGRIARFQKALGLLVASPGIELVEVAAACGYYDQAHLSREFTEFAGQSPGQHRRHLIEKMARETPPNLVQFLQDA